MAKKKMNGFVFALRAIFGFLIGLIGWLAIFYFIPRPGATDGPTVGLIGLGIFVVSFFVNAPHCRLELDSFKSFLAFVLIYIPLFPIIGFIFMLRGAADFRKGKKKGQKNGKGKKGNKGVFVARALVGFFICLIGWFFMFVSISGLTKIDDAIGNRTTLPLVALAAFIVGNIVSPSSCRVKIRSIGGLFYAVLIYAYFFPIVGLFYLFSGIRHPHKAERNRRAEEDDEPKKPDPNKPKKQGGADIMAREIKRGCASFQHYARSEYISGEVYIVNPSFRGLHSGNTSVTLTIKIKVADKGGYMSEAAHRVKEDLETYVDEIFDLMDSLTDVWYDRIDELQDENYVDMFGKWEFDWEIVPIH